MFEIVNQSKISNSIYDKNISKAEKQSKLQIFPIEAEYMTRK